MAKAIQPLAAEHGADESEARARILEAAFAAFTQRGYASTSTLEIATRARVSKRELYALVGNKREMLGACIGARAMRFQVPSGLPQPVDRDGLESLLMAFGIHLVREVTEPTVVAVFRLAIAEAIHSPEVANTLESIGREASRTALRQIMAAALTGRLIAGNADQLAEQFAGLLWGSLMVSLLLGVAERPSAREAGVRARAAAAAFLVLNPPVEVRASRSPGRSG
jgi:AcrR family transcriptional regulator